jgi:hypothetical protein
MIHRRVGLPVFEGIGSRLCLARRVGSQMRQHRAIRPGLGLPGIHLERARQELVGLRVLLGVHRMIHQQQHAWDVIRILLEDLAQQLQHPAAGVGLIGARQPVQ